MKRLSCFEGHRNLVATNALLKAWAREARKEILDRPERFHSTYNPFW